MMKKVFRAVLFLAVFALLFQLITPLFVPKNNAKYMGIHEDEAKGFLGEAPDSIDVLFLGDSEVFSTFIPLQIWRDHGITSYLCSTGDQVIYQSYAYLKRMFQYHSPKIVVFEANALYRDFGLAEMVSYELEEVFPYLRYHDRWKSLNSEDWGGKVEFRNLIRDKGYTYRTRAIPADDADYMIPVEDSRPISSLNVWYFEKIRTFCEEQGAQLLVVSAPSTTNWDYYHHNGVEQMLQGKNIPYVDMNLMQEQIPINWQMDSYDGGDHLNYAGAVKVTDFMGRLLWDTGLFADKRQEAAYATWNAALEEFQAVVASE